MKNNIFLFLTIHLTNLKLIQNNLSNEYNDISSSKKIKYFIYSIICIIICYIFIKIKVNKKPSSNIIRLGDEIPRIYNENEEIRGEYSKFISKKRRKAKTPISLVNEEGKIIFGTFNKEFEIMDLLKAKNPTRFPNFLNKHKLTLWETCEVHLEK